MASRRSPTSAEIGRIAADAEQEALMAMEVDETSLEVADGTKASLRRILGCKQTMDRHNVLRKHTEYVPQEGELAVEISVKLWFALLCSCFFFPTSGRSGLLSILPYLDNLHEMKSANWAAAIHEYLISGVQQCQEHVKAVVTGAATCKTIFLTGCVPALGRKRKEAERKKNDEEEEHRKRKEEEEEQRKRKEEEERTKKEEEAERKRKEEEEEKGKRKEEEEAERKRKEEEEEKRNEEENRKMEEEAASYFAILIVSTSFSWDEEKTTTGVIYSMSEDYRYHKATKANVSTSEPIFVDSQESTDTLPKGKKDEKRDYVTLEVLGVDEKSLIERFLNECIIN
ncbi:hypothetical protein Taro_006588 [Colocasia esculenta]|uniref:Uncharacterized protein n=1 Tax=Colocasia esculenta TaxID=4460 RepID=A0A843TWH1_COLES|nr:hypothetical protein [Colocasia esculenta]